MKVKEKTKLKITWKGALESVWWVVSSKRQNDELWGGEQPFDHQTASCSHSLEEFNTQPKHFIHTFIHSSMSYCLNHLTDAPSAVASADEFTDDLLKSSPNNFRFLLLLCWIKEIY